MWRGRVVRFVRFAKGWVALTRREGGARGKGSCMFFELGEDGGGVVGAIGRRWGLLLGHSVGFVYIVEDTDRKRY